jgi:hypothetical protein
MTRANPVIFSWCDKHSLRTMNEAAHKYNRHHVCADSSELQ